MLSKENKLAIIDEYKTHEGDTGSPEVQVAILSNEIRRLTDHLKANKHDFQTRRSLLMKVGQRRRQLRYLNSRSVDRYRTLIARLGLRR
ncbi:MAG: 30S ribosomal protein S15 [Dehalococcoidia bacterium]|nr:30S ribosomal protein S15 [Dehalococcoidia bacterium]